MGKQWGMKQRFGFMPTEAGNTVVLPGHGNRFKQDCGQSLRRLNIDFLG